MTFLERTELWSYIVTIIGLPLAIFVFLREQRKEREGDEEEIYQRLMDNYSGFLKLIIENSDLQLRAGLSVELSGEQKDRRLTIFEMLTSLFEQAYILAYDRKMNRNQRRRWQSWEDYMREWCLRKDYRMLLPQLLQGEDEEFAGYISRVAKECETVA